MLQLANGAIWRIDRVEPNRKNPPWVVMRSSDLLLFLPEAANEGLAGLWAFLLPR